MKTQQLKFSMLLILLALFGIGFYSCKDDPDEDDTSTVSQQERDFATKASNSNMAEIQFGQLAVQRAENDSIIAFAQQMVGDHTTAQSQLDSIARNLNVALPDSMDSAHNKLYSFLSTLSSFSFDSAYIHNQVIDHQNARDLLQKQLDEGKDSMLVGYARKQLPIIIMHHERALELRDQINGGESR